MNCEQGRTLLHEYSDGAIEDGLRKEADAHFAACGPCGAALERVRKVERLVVDALPVPELPETFWTAQQRSVIARASRAVAPSRRGRRPVSFWIGAAGVGLAAVCLVGVGLYLLLGARAGLPSNAETAQQLPSPVSRSVERPTPEDSARDTRPGVAVPSVRGSSDRNLPSPPAPREPSPSTPPAPPREAVGASRLPGSPEHLTLMTQENIRAGLADSASDRVLSLIRAADARLGELHSALDAKDESMAEELAKAYTLIVRQGVSFVCKDREEDAQELAAARSMAKTYAGWKISTLAALEPGAGGSLKSALHDAVLASRELAGQ